MRGHPPLPVLLACVVIVMGVAIVVRTISLGGGQLGLLIGGLLILGAALRLYLLTHS